MCPPADKKAKMEVGLDTKVDTKPKTDKVSFTGGDKRPCHLVLVLPTLLLISAKVLHDRFVDY